VLAQHHQGQVTVARLLALLQQLRCLIREFCAYLKTYRAAPSPRRRTGFVLLDRRRARLLGRKRVTSGRRMVPAA